MLKKFLMTTTAIMLAAVSVVSAQEFVPNDPGYDQFQWNLRVINMPSVWSRGYFGDGAVIGVIDSGLYIAHDDIDYENVIGTYNVFNDSENVADAVGHGSFVTGIMSSIIGNENRISGIADKAKLVIIKAFDNNYQTSEDEIVKALDIALENKVDVLNMSLGVSVNSEAIKEKIDELVESGTIIVASVGNEGEDPQTCHNLQYPAAYGNVIGVGAVTYDETSGEFERCAFSQMNESVFVVAPGGAKTLEDTEEGPFIPSIYNVPVPNEYVALNNGTSFAAPHVSAVAAIAKSVYPDLTTEQFKKILKKTSMDLGTDEQRGCDTDYGWGLIDAGKIIDEVEVLAGISEPSHKTETEFVFDPYNYRDFSCDGENITVDTVDGGAVIYAAEFDGNRMTDVRSIKISDYETDDRGLRTISLEKKPSKLFLWHGMQSCINAWENTQTE